MSDIGRGRANGESAVKTYMQECKVVTFLAKFATLDLKWLLSEIHADLQ